MGFFRPTFAEIDLGALVHNFDAARSCVSKDIGIMAMVKADAYGHGAVQVSKKLAGHGVASLGVATVEEGLELKESGIRLPIVVMGGLMGMGASASEKAVDIGLIPVVHSLEVLDLLEETCKAAGKKGIDIHLKIDTGMSRLGALPSRVDRLLDELKGLRYVRLDGVMTHFAEAEDEDYTSYQMKVFDDVAQKIRAVFGPVNVWHVANSAAIIDGRYIASGYGKTTWVRPGLMLYGAYPTPEYRSKVSLRPVMSLKSKVALIKTVPAGTKVSYSCTYTTKGKTRIAIVPMGYADGYPWSLSNKGIVLINGKRVPVIGRVTMDMVIVDISDIYAHVGDEVVLMGRQGEEEVSVDEFAALAGTISYEIFCGISKRMPRVYVGK